MTESQEFTAMLEKIPTHIFLTPRRHIWQEGDEFLMPNGTWVTAFLSNDSVMDMEKDRARRPIPIQIRRNAAFWALYEKLATGDINGVGYVPAIDMDNESGEPSLYVQELRHCFSGIAQFWTESDLKKVFPILGGEQNIIHHLSSGCLLPKWMAGEI